MGYFFFNGMKVGWVGNMSEPWERLQAESDGWACVYMYENSQRIN